MKKWFVSAAVIGFFSTVMFCSAAKAAPGEKSGFAALQGVTAEALPASEMKAVSGELNAYDIAAALTAEAANLSKFPGLQADTLKLAAWYTTNAAAINAAFQKLGLLTPCKSCGH
jgi:hypothetical protein